VACLDGAATIPRYRPVAESFDCWVPRDLRAALLDVVLADEERLLRYAVLWGPERSQDLLTLLELNLEAYPRSAETHVWLAQAHLALEDEAAARRALETALAIDPGHERGRRLLERLGGG
jgi:hypothetical protein